MLNFASMASSPGVSRFTSITSAVTYPPRRLHSSSCGAYVLSTCSAEASSGKFAGRLRRICRRMHLLRRSILRQIRRSLPALVFDADSCEVIPYLIVFEKRPLFVRNSQQSHGDLLL